MSDRNIAPEPIILRISGGYRSLSTPSVYAFAPTVPEPEPILADDGFDRNCWTSVFEHVRVPSAVVAEAVRLLRAGGLFILTIDLDMSGVFEIDVDGHARLCAALREHFTYLYPERTVHPGDVLGPYGSIASNRERPIQTWWYHLKQYVLKPMLGRRSMPMHYLAVQAFTLTKI